MTTSNHQANLAGRKPPARTAGGDRAGADAAPSRRGEPVSPNTDAGELYRLLVEGVRDYAIFALDPTGRVSSWNPGAERIKGYKASEIIGRHFSTFYPAEDLASGKPAWELEVAAEDGRFEDEGWRLRKDGSRFWANVVITALRNDAGALVGFAKVTRDLTERRAAEDHAVATARRLAEAEAASRTKSAFLTAMSHELRTPINATMGYTELVASGIGGPVTEQQHVYLDRIRASQQHLLGIITDLLDYGRVEAGQMQFETGPVSIAGVVGRALEMIAPQAEAKDLTVVHAPGDGGLTARADEARSAQIVLNLLSNAVKFTPASGRVTVESWAAGRRIFVAVTDTGPGVPADQQAAIFEPFVQLGRSLSSAHHGTGLGLSISRDLARAMGGDVTVASVEGAGATFTLVLPQH